MKRLSTRAWAYVCIGLLLVLAVVFSLVNRRMQAQISDDPLSQGIAERWNAALPAGFAKECAGQIADGAGLQFARLVYDEDIAGLLAKWTPPGETAQAEFDALIDAFLANAPPEEAARRAARAGRKLDLLFPFRRGGRARRHSAGLPPRRPRDVPRRAAGVRARLFYPLHIQNAPCAHFMAYGAFVLRYQTVPKRPKNFSKSA